MLLYDLKTFFMHSRHFMTLVLAPVSPLKVNTPQHHMLHSSQALPEKREEAYGCHLRREKFRKVNHFNVIYVETFCHKSKIALIGSEL